MCQTLLQSSARRVSWISDMAAADHYQQSKVDSKLDDMEKVRKNDELSNWQVHKSENTQILLETS